MRRSHVALLAALALAAPGCTDREEAELAEPGGMGAGQPEAPGPDVTPPQEILHEGPPAPGVEMDTTAGRPD